MRTLGAVTLFLCLLFGLAACPSWAGPGPFTGVDIRDVGTRHWFNHFDGLMLDRTPYEDDLVDEARMFLSWADGPGREKLTPPPSSIRVMEWSPGRLDLLLIHTTGSGHQARARFSQATFLGMTQTLEGPGPSLPLGAPTLTASLKDLLLCLRSSDGRIVVANPLGAGGYRSSDSALLMTPAMDPSRTRTPSIKRLGKGKWKGRPTGAGYMIPARTDPEYYEGLPFVRLRRTDRPHDEYGIHGPISRGGTYPIHWRLDGETLSRLRWMGRKPAQEIADKLAEGGLLDEDDRLVRGRVSNGCLRQRPRDIKELFAILAGVDDGVPVTVTYGPDPHGTQHPLPWETRRFAVATDQKDDDGLTVMFTGQIDGAAGRDPDALPFPTAEEIAADRGRM